MPQLETSSYPEVKQSFCNDGFARLPSFLTPEAVDELLQQIERYIKEVAPARPVEEIFYEDKRDPSSLKQVQQLWRNDLYFEALMTKGPFIQLAEELLDGPAVPRNLQYFNKAAGVGMPTPAHQDGFYFMLDPCAAVTMWLALDNVDEENGCMRYVRGSHRRGMRAHGSTHTLGFSQGIKDYPSEIDLADEVALPASPGDLLAHDALTIHRADGNRSADRSRRALGFIYYSQRAKEDSVAHQAYQAALSQRMKAAGKI